MAMICNVIYAGGAKPRQSSGGSSSSSAGDITVDVSGFEMITGANVQLALNQVDKMLARNENNDSLLYSLDPLEDIIDAQTTVPLSSLEIKTIDGRPSHKAPGAKVYDDFGTVGYIDKVTATEAIITTVSSRGGR